MIEFWKLLWTIFDILIKVIVVASIFALLIYFLMSSVEKRDQTCLDTLIPRRLVGNVCQEYVGSEWINITLPFNDGPEYNEAGLKVEQK